MLEHMSDILASLRTSNVSLRWLLLQSSGSQKKLRAAVASAAPPGNDLLTLLLEISQLEDEARHWHASKAQMQSFEGVPGVPTGVTRQVSHNPRHRNVKNRWMVYSKCLMASKSSSSIKEMCLWGVVMTQNSILGDSASDCISWLQRWPRLPPCGMRNLPFTICVTFGHLVLHVKDDLP